MQQASTPSDSAHSLRPPLVAALAAAVCAAHGAVPGLHGLDAGDFVTAGATLGVPHATGFPSLLPILAGSSLIPLANIAHRAALTSALLTGVAAFALAALCGRLMVRRAQPPNHAAWAAAAASLAATVALPPVALHARTVDVYAASLAATLAAFTILGALRTAWHPRLLAVLGVVVGVGVGLHVTFRLFAPVIVIAALVTARGRPGSRAATAVASVLGGVALLAHAWLVVAAQGDTPHAWGETTSIGALFDHLSGREIRDGLRGEMGGTSFVIATNLRRLASSVAGPLALFALPALVALARSRDRVLAVSLLAAVAIDVAYSVLINPMGIVDDQVGQVAGVVVVALGVTATGSVASGAAQRIGRPLALVGAVAPALFVAGFGASAFAERWGALSVDSTAEDLALITLDRAPPAAAATFTSDLLSGGALFATMVVDARPDMTAIGRGFVSNRDSLVRAERLGYFDLLDRSELLALPDDRARAFPVAITAILERNVGQRALLWEVAGMTTDLPPPLDVSTVWPLGEVVTSGPTWRCEPGPTSLCAAPDAAFGMRARPWATGRGYRRWLASQHGHLATRAYAGQQLDEARRHFLAAAALVPESAAWQNSLAVVTAAGGDTAEALELSLAALALDPTSRTAVGNGLGYASTLGDAAAIELLERRAGQLGMLLGTPR